MNIGQLARDGVNPSRMRSALIEVFYIVETDVTAICRKTTANGRLVCRGVEKQGNAMSWYLSFLDQLARDPSLCGEAAYSSRIMGDVMVME